MRRSGDRVRIAINLIDADDQGIIWSETYDRSLSDILELQSDVARAVTTRIAVTIAPQERERLSHASTVPPQAYENYLKGRALWNRRREDDLRTAPRLFEEAIAQDLNYAPAYAGLADCYAVLSNVATSAVAPTEVMPRARAAACRALKLDPNLADAHASLAYGALFFEWDWQAAGVHFKRALELNPSYGTARQWYAEYFATLGRSDEAMAEIKRARNLDPLSLAIRAAQAGAMYHARQYDDSIAESRTTLALEPNFVLAYVNLGRAWMMKREYPKAIAELELAVQLTGGNSTLLLAMLAHAHGLARRMREAKAIVNQLTSIARHKYVSPFHFATAYAGLNDHDRAFQWLRRANAERCEYLVYLHQEPAADPIRSDPRFRKIVPPPPSPNRQ